VFAFLDINPISRGHTLVLPKSHVARLSGLKEAEVPGLMLALQKVTRAIEESLTPEGLNIFVNQGEVAGQVVPHLHIHVVPRSGGDGIELVTPVVEMSESDFREVSNRIGKAIKV